MKKLLLTLLALILLNLSQTQAQMLQGSLLFGVPTNEFAENTEATGIGFNLGAFFPMAPALPIYVGIEGGYQIYGSTTNEINQDLLIGLGTTTRIPLRFDVETNNNIIHGHAVLRVVAPLPIVQIYGDALVGGRYIYTRTTVQNRSEERANNILRAADINPDEEIQATTNVDDWIFSYGFGGGVMIGGGPLKFNLRVVYLLGTEAEYLDQEAVENAPEPVIIPDEANPPQNFLAVPTKNSRTDMFFIEAGVVFNLGL